MKIEECKHTEKDVLNVIEIKSIELDAPPHKGGVNNITIKGVMKDYQDLKKVTIKTYFLGVRVDSRDATNEQSLDTGDEMVFRYGAEIPSIAPSATYNV